MGASSSPTVYKLTRPELMLLLGMSHFLVEYEDKYRVVARLNGATPPAGRVQLNVQHGEAYPSDMARRKLVRKGASPEVVDAALADILAARDCNQR